SLPILEGWSELAAVAAITERVELGTLVTPPFFRNPAVLAKQVATIDQISNGRTIVGLGSGWFASEYEAYGAPFPPVGERLQALEETCEVLKRLWTEEQATFAGKYAHVEQAYCEPKPARRPPILIGGGGERKLMRIAARHADIWNNVAVSQAQLGAQGEVLRRRRGEGERDPAAVRVSPPCPGGVAPHEAAARRAPRQAAP